MVTRNIAGPYDDFHAPDSMIRKMHSLSTEAARARTATGTYWFDRFSGIFDPAFWYPGYLYSVAFRVSEGFERGEGFVARRRVFFFCIASLKWRREANEQFAIATTGFRSHDQSEEHMTFVHSGIFRRRPIRSRSPFRRSSETHGWLIRVVVTYEALPACVYIHILISLFRWVAFP
jgi:hypothetical protein